MNMRIMFRMSFLKATKKFLLAILLFLFCGSISFAQTYEESFPKQFQKALGLKQVYEQLLIEDGIQNVAFYLSIVFPEMERYTETRDELETLFTKITYTTINDYEGCSIGAFQMKPKFAEDVELYIQKDKELRNRYSELYLTDEISEFTKKHNRIVRLQSKNYQLLYLRAFVDICRAKYDLINETIENQLKVIATAYNVGLRDMEYLRKQMKKTSFPDGVNAEGSKWNYSELVVHYYSMWKDEENLLKNK